MWYLYLLLCDKKTFYVGISNDLAKRLNEHRNKESFYTRKFFCVEIVYCEKYSTVSEAAKREKQIKGWNHAKKQMLVDGNIGINACPEIVESLR
ncbi:MAG TPA: GIY-YIG nuclease family protein [Candidatus Paceibacterota bacterium]|nr:GIY-YIG nuclease family protein [Candidatus Pacearchaeota archaeon]HRZ50793.1 GIY-YIG nuclease family protein [Candidatus Paceibacterota bacterium]HSA36514.1 GIY-YIG nuclease family protein [Candidatus Paceibacterota bacterium]